MKEMICISCPIGCHLQVTIAESNNESNNEIKIRGNKCPRGIEYARAEITAPQRVVTSTVATDDKDRPRLPVKTLKAFPREKIDELLQILCNVQVELPVSCGAIILTNACDTGIDVVATADF